MIEHDDRQTGRFGGAKRREGGDAAVHGDHHRDTLLPQSQQRRRVRPIALDQTIGDIERTATPMAAKKRCSNAAEVAPSTS
jgi:hypothetical protein